MYMGLVAVKLSYLKLHPLEVVSRYRDPQLQVYFGTKQGLIFEDE